MLSIFALAFGATLIGSMSGGGSGLILIPIWIHFGYALPLAIATQQLSGIFWAPIASYNYLKFRPFDARLTSGMLVVGLVGAVLGVGTITRADQQLVKHCIGWIILALLVFMLLNKKSGIERGTARVSRSLTSLAAFPLGFYESFFGSGNGLFTAFLLIKARGFDLPTALGHYYLIATG